jgi:hypothetical protein
MLRLGCGRTNITPEPGLPMVGMPGSPRGEGVQWPLQGRVVLFDDGETRSAVVCLDLIALVSAQVAELRDVIAAQADLDPGHVLIACSHTHRAPFTETGWGATDETVRPYLDFAFSRIREAAADAAASFQPAALGIGRQHVPGWAFNRRPIYAGGQVGTHGPARGTGFIRMEDTADEEIIALVARGDDGTILGGLVDFACHPTAMGHDPVYSADYPGVLTETLEMRSGGIFGFLLGAAGDTSTPDPTSFDPESGFGPEHTRAMGEALAAAADSAIAAAQPVSGQPIRVATTQVRIPRRRATPVLVELARWYLEERPDDLDELAFTRRFYGHDYTFNDGVQFGNERHAEEMLRMWDWQQDKSDDALTETIEMQAMAIGGVAIVGFPVELFTAFGRRVKTESPIANTIVSSLTNGWHGYAPTLEAFDRGGYEPRFAYPSRLVPNAGDRLTDAALDLLGRLARA